MADKKFTPGPWQWDEPSNWHGLDARVWVREPYGVVAQVPIEAWRPKSVGRANAALIAAAPGMYEALKKIADNYGGCRCDHTTNECCENPAIGEFCPHCIAEIALAKAEGRQ